MKGWIAFAVVVGLVCLGWYLHSEWYDEGWNDRDRQAKDEATEATNRHEGRINALDIAYAQAKGNLQARLDAELVKPPRIIRVCSKPLVRAPDSAQATSQPPAAQPGEQGGSTGQDDAGYRMFRDWLLREAASTELDREAVVDAEAGWPQ